MFILLSSLSLYALRMLVSTLDFWLSTLNFWLCSPKSTQVILKLKVLSIEQIWYFHFRFSLWWWTSEQRILLLCASGYIFNVQRWQCYAAQHEDIKVILFYILNKRTFSCVVVFARALCGMCCATRSDPLTLRHGSWDFDSSAALRQGSALKKSSTFDVDRTSCEKYIRVSRTMKCVVKYT